MINQLVTAYGSQFDGGPNGKSEWIVMNEQQEEIYRLPTHWSEKDFMAAMHFGRKFEELAFNVGIDFQKAKTPQELLDLRALLQTYERRIELIIEQNNKLSTELDRIYNEQQLKELNNTNLN